MLIGNHSVLLKTPGRSFGGLIATYRSNWNTNGSRMNLFSGEAYIPSYTSVPNGYNILGWVPSRTSGGMASYTQIISTSDITFANLAGGKNAEADILGAGDITSANLGLIVSAVAALTGSAALSADIVGILNAVAALTGTSDIDAALGAISDLVASLSGTASVTGTNIAYGSLSADIVVTGDALSTANIGEAVWQSIAETGYTYQEAIKILLAIAAGKTTIVDLGGGAATVTFRNLGDDLDRVVADMTNSERDSLTYDLS